MTTEVEVHVNVHVHDGVGLIQLNRPDKLNAIGALTRQQLGEAISQKGSAPRGLLRLCTSSGFGRNHVAPAMSAQLTPAESQRRHRYEVTIRNAEDFLKEHRRRRLPWEPIADHWPKERRYTRPSLFIA